MNSLIPLSLGAAALAALTVLILTQPWWRPRLSRRDERRPAGTDFSEASERKNLNAAIYRDQLAELERDRALALIADTDYQSARDEINRRLLDDIDGAPQEKPSAQASAAGKRRAPTWFALLLLVPLAAASIYLQLGTPAAALDTASQARKSMMDMEQAINSLATKLKAQPDNPDGWAMLARSYGMLGRWDEAIDAFGKIGPSLETNPDLLATLAEITFRQANNQFTEESRRLIAKALAVSPQHMHALLMSGSDAFQSGRWQLAIDAWEKLVVQLEPGSEDEREIAEGIAKARQELGLKVSPGGTAAKAKAAVTGMPSGKEAISGRVELASDVRKLAKPDDTVFIFARAVSTSDVPAPRMPLAAKRIRVADLPFDFTLDDSMAMSPAMKISSFAQVRIEARVSATGEALPKSGDIMGQSDPIKPGSKGVKVRIDKPVP